VKTETLVTAPRLLERIAKRRGVRHFVKFAIVGSSGAIVSLVIYTVLQHYAAPELRKPLDGWFFSAGFLGGGISNYFLNRAWTFRSTSGSFAQGVKFMTVSSVALIVGLALKAMTTPTLGAGHRTWLIGTAGGVVVNFFVNKYWTFSEGRTPAP